MMNDDIEPLEPALWFRRIEMIANGELGCVEHSLRHAAHMLQLTPRPLRDQVGLSTDEDTFEALLDSGDFDTAARHLVARPTALSVESGDGVESFRATISCMVLDRVIDGTGETIANAVLNAWTTCLMALKSEYGADLLHLVDPPQRRDQSELHRLPGSL